MGIESRHGDSWLTDAAADEEICGESADADDAFFRQQCRDLGQRLVDRGEADA